MRGVCVIIGGVKRFLRLLFFSLCAGRACCAAGTEPLRVADVLAMDRADIAKTPSCTLRVRVSFLARWVEEAFLATDPGDPDGPAIFVTNLTGQPGPELLRRLEVGDILEIEGRPEPLLLEPGIAVTGARRVGHESAPPPPRRSALGIRAGLYNNRRVTVSGVVIGARVERNDKTEISILELSSEEGTLAVRFRGVLPDLAGLRDAEVTVEGVVVPSFNPRAEFTDAEVEAFGLSSLAVVRRGPEDPFAVPACDPRGPLAWRPNGPPLHARLLTGEVTYADSAAGSFVVQRGLAAVRVFASGPLPAVGAQVEVVGFCVRREGCGVLANALWRAHGSDAEPVRPYPLSLAETTEFDVGGFFGDNDIHFRLVEVTGRVTDVIRPDGACVRLFLSVDGRTVVVELPFVPEDLAGYEDHPRISAVGVMDARLRQNRTLGRMFVFDELTILPRTPDDLRLLSDGAWMWRRAVRYGKVLLMLSLLPLAAYVGFLLLRRQRERERAGAITADRRRIAGELHDSISQHISAAKLWVFAARTAAGETLPGPAGDALTMAANVLEATRREIRNAILDLQGDELLAESPKTLLQRFARASDIVGRIRVRTALRGLPADLPVGVKRDLLALVQEATANAVRHGQARNVILVCEGDGSAFALSVLNDGAPFDVAAAPGPEAGHFGLSNMRERAARSGFALAFGEVRGYRAVTLTRKRVET